MLDDHVAGREDLSRQLWGLLAFTLWYERHVEGIRRDAARGRRRLSASVAAADRVRSVASAAMKVWIDMTASAHPLVFRPLVELLLARGDEVEITAREYAQTLQLIESARDDARRRSATTAGARALGKARQMRLAPAARCAAGRKGRDFDVALAHGSHELTMTARRLGIPSATTFDYEWAWLPAPARLPRRDAGRRPRLDPDRAPGAATAPCRRSCSSTRA